MQPIRLLFALVALVGPACVLFVNDDPGSLGGACKFTGQDSAACGVCLATNCQKEINACCLNSSCRDRGMAAVDSCSSGTSSACLSTDLTTELQTCIAESCGKECLGGTTNCSTSANECTCNVQLGNPNMTACGETTIRNSLCCADQDWPSRSAGCRCTYWGCTIQSTRCDCSVRSFIGSSTDYKDACYPPQGGGYHCCRDSVGSCSCAMTPCFSETEVPDCSLDNAGCSTGSSYESKRVTVCAQ